MDDPPIHYIMSAEHVGVAEVKNGILNVGGVEIFVGHNWECHGVASVYVRRDSKDLSVFQVLMSRGDGFAQEELDRQNEEAARYPLGPKEYWRSEMVGKYGTPDSRMTNEDFEEYWAEGELDA